MELRPEFQIRTVIKALTDVVLPAVDTGNSLAQEQGKLAVSVLQMALRNLPLMYAYDRVELSELATLATELCGIIEDQDAMVQAGERLHADLTTATDFIGRAGAAPSEMHDAVFALRASIGAFVSEGYGELDSESATRLSRAVTAHARSQLLRERALLIDQGWESAPEKIPEITTLIEGKQSEVCEA